MKLINGEVKIKHKRGEAWRMIESLPNFDSVRSRVKVIRQARYFLADRHELFKRLESFQSLVKSVELFDKTLLMGEEILCRYAQGESDAGKLEEELRDFRDQLQSDAGQLQPTWWEEDGQAADDVNELMRSLWSEVWGLIERLQDASKSTLDDDRIGVPKWLLEFNQQEAPRFKHAGRSNDELAAEILAKSIELPKTYMGDFEVEDGDFALAAKRFVVREDVVSFEFEGEGDEGRFRLEGSLARKGDGQLEVKCFNYSASQFQDMQEATIELKVVKPVFGACKVVGEWRQDGEVWQFSGELSPYRPPSSGNMRTIPLG